MTEVAGGLAVRPGVDVLGDPGRAAASSASCPAGPAGERLDLLVRHAAELLCAPHAQVSLAGEHEQVIAAAHGVWLTEDNHNGPLTDSLCAVTAAAAQPLVIPDAPAHPWVGGGVRPVVTTSPASATFGCCGHVPDGVSVAM